MKAPNLPTLRLRRPAPQEGQARGSPPLAGLGEDMRPEQIVQSVEHLGDPQIADIVHRGDELAPEIAQHVLPFELARRDVVELLLEIGGEVVLDIAAEEALEKGRDQPSLVFGIEPLLVEADIFAVAEHVQRRGIGGGAADAELLHLLDQGRFAIAGRRLGEVLLRLDLARIERFALG